MPLGSNQVDPKRLHFQVLLMHYGVRNAQVEVSLQAVRTDLLCQLFKQTKLCLRVFGLES